MKCDCCERKLGDEFLQGAPTPSGAPTYFCDEGCEQAEAMADVCCCGDGMVGHPGAFDSGHSPVSMKDYYLSQQTWVPTKNN